MSDGRLLEGKYLSDDGSNVELEQNGTVIRLPSAKVARVELAYPGVPICFRRKGNPERVCQGKLFLLYGDAVEIIGGPGDTKKERVDISQISDMEFQRTSESQLVIPRVRPGANVRLILPEGNVQGKVEASEAGAVTLRDTNNQTIQVREEKIAQLQLPSPAAGFQWKRLVPGLPQYQRGARTRAFLIWGLMGTFGAGALWEQRQAQAEVARARSNSVYLYSGIGSRESVFASHERNAKYLGAGLLFVYAYHFADEFYLTGAGTGKDVRIGVTIPLP